MLMHEMRTAGIPNEITEWLERRFSKRKTTLRFDDYASDVFPVMNRLDQGDPFSQLLYILYNASLFRLLKKKGLNALGFVDDAAGGVRAKTFNEAHEKLREAMEGENGVLKWAETHNCIFGIPKWQLLDCTPKTREAPHPKLVGRTTRVPDQGEGVTIGGRLIEVKRVAKFLGILIDAGLRWKEQGAMVVRRGDDWVTKFRRVAQVTKGIPKRYIKQAYEGMAIPRMLYGADVFLTPTRVTVKKRKDERNSHPIVRQLESIHRRAGIMLSGAMRTTAADIVNIHANLMRISDIVDKHLYRAAIRYATLPKNHPLHKRVRRAASRFVKRHRSPLHWLFHKYHIQPEAIETIKATRYPASWRSLIEIIETKDAVEAIEKEENDTGLKIFTDGSGYEGGIGASMVMFEGGEETEVRRVHIGSDKEHEVYEGEVSGMALVMKTLYKRPKVTRATVYIDNSASIQATQLRRPAPSHYLVDEVHRGMTEVMKKHRGAKVRLQWIPVHVGVKGNERADEEAKLAAMDPRNTTPQIRLPKLFRSKLPISATAAKRVQLESIHRRHNAAWRKSRRRLKFKDIDPGTPKDASKRFAKLTDTLPRSVTSLLVQLRTGHTPLQHHLHNIQQSESPACPNCDYPNETPFHYVMHCPAYETQRKVMLRATHSKDGRATFQTLITTADQIPHLFRFIAATKRFESTWGNIPDVPIPANATTTRRTMHTQHTSTHQTHSMSSLDRTKDGRLITIPARQF